MQGRADDGHADLRTQSAEFLRRRRISGEGCEPFEEVVEPCWGDDCEDQLRLVTDVLPRVYDSLRDEDEGARRCFSQIAIEVDAKSPFERVPDLILMLVKVQWRPLAGAATLSNAVNTPLVCAPRILNVSGPPTGFLTAAPSPGTRKTLSEVSLAMGSHIAMETEV